MDDRMEHDLLGTLPVPRDALYGIHTARALINFPIARRPVCPQLVHAYGRQVRVLGPTTSWATGRTKNLRRLRQPVSR